MPRNPNVDPSPFFLEGGAVGCLLIHGFTGSPAEMRLLGEYLHGSGLTVSAPLLPGHGREPEDLNHVTWTDWVDSADDALQALRTRCRRVFIGGLSLGALVALHLAARYGNPSDPSWTPSGLALYSPGLRAANKLLLLAPILRHLVRQRPGDPESNSDCTDPEAPGRLWHYETTPTTGAYEVLKMQRVTRRLLPQVLTPAIIFYSTQDATLDPSSARLVLEGLGSPDKELVTVHRSGHCMTVDAEREAIFARTYGFITVHGAA